MNISFGALFLSQYYIYQQSKLLGYIQTLPDFSADKIDVLSDTGRLNHRRTCQDYALQASSMLPFGTWLEVSMSKFS
jgi:hypothetical protein